MKINYNNLNYKILLEMLDGQVDNISNVVGKGKSNLTSKQEIAEKNIQTTSNEILNLLGKISEQDRKTLVSSLIKYNLPIDTKKIEQLVSYLQDKPEKNNSELIKSFIILTKNNIPISKSLLEGLAANFKQNNSLSNKLNNLFNKTETGEIIATKKEGEIIQKENTSDGKPKTPNIKSSIKPNLFNTQISNHTTQKDSLLLTIMRQLIINPSNTEKTLTDQLKEYPEQLIKSIQLLQEQGDNSQQKVIQHLIGQQLINHQDKNLLLNLEIPIFFTQYKKFIPAYLNIKKDINNGETKDMNLSLKNYKINFIISLEKRGIIKAETYISTGRIKILFTCNRKETMELIESEFINLKESLENIGISVENPSINYSNLNTEDINNTLSANIGIDHSHIDNFLHIDIKV